MAYLVLAVLCSLGIGMIFKWTERRDLDRIALLTVNYGAAGLLALILLAADGELAAGRLPTPALAAFGVALGALFIGGFFLLALATREAGMGLAIAAMRVSVVIPFLASWVIWGEQPTTVNLLGLTLALVAFGLLAHKPGSGAGHDGQPAQARKGRAVAVLVALFVVGGLVDTSMKVFDQEFSSEASPALFLLFVFGVAFFIGVGLVVVRRVQAGHWPQRIIVPIGVMLGIVNYGSAAFFLQAVSRLPGTFVFPANNVAIVVGAAVLGVWVWREDLSRANWLGVGLAALALVLLRG